MGFPKLPPGRRLAALLVLLSLASGCRSADAKVWNLREVHDADGSPKRIGRVRTDIEHTLVSLFERSAFGGPKGFGDEPEAIDDPLGVCLENLVELQECNLKKLQVRGQLIEMATWLSGDCTYVLTRERCAKAFAAVGPELGVEGPRFIGEDEVTATPTEVADALRELIEVAGIMVRGGGDATRERLAQACTAIRELNLDRDGARRLLSAANAFAGRGEFQGPGPIRDMHLDLMKRCTALGLATVLRDSSPRVRAAALVAAVKISDERAPDEMLAALEDENLEVRTRAMRLITSLGTPGLPRTAQPGLTPEEFWMGEIYAILSLGIEGPTAVAGCHAMARLSGRPATLRPEEWVAWWEDREGGAL